MPVAIICASHLLDRRGGEPEGKGKKEEAAVRRLHQSTGKKKKEKGVHNGLLSPEKGEKKRKFLAGGVRGASRPGFKEKKHLF